VYAQQGQLILSNHRRQANNQTSVEVSGLYTEDNEEMEAAFCGDNIRIRLRGISDEDILPGFVLTSPSKPVKAVTAFKADLSILETKSIICGGYSCVLHAHTLAEEVTITVSIPHPLVKTEIRLMNRHYFTTLSERRVASPRSPLNSPRRE
jgi:translation elongation factor EF-1alpha